MDPKQILMQEIIDKVGDTISKQTVSEKVELFMRYGNVFLLFEIMSLRKDLEKIKREKKSILNMKIENPTPL